MGKNNVNEAFKHSALTPLPAFRFTPEQRRSLLDLMATFANAVQLEAFVDLLEARTQRFQSRLLGFGRLPALECHFYRAEMSKQQPPQTLLQFRRETYRYVGLCDTRAPRTLFQILHRSGAVVGSRNGQRLALAASRSRRQGQASERVRPAARALPRCRGSKPSRDCGVGLDVPSPAP
jgi:hypothetical protein